MCPEFLTQPNKSSALRKAVLPAALVMLLLAGGLRFEGIAVFPPGLSRDEGQAIVLPYLARVSGVFPLFETEEPEPLFRALMTLVSPMTGDTIAVSRMVNGLIGVVSVALAYWAALQLLPDASPWVRHGAALAAAGALTVALGHVTLSRSLYRGLLQVPLMLAMTGFALRGLHDGRRIHFALAGGLAALAMLTYTAAYTLPLAFAVLGAALMLLRRSSVRIWLPGLLITALAATLVLLPMIARVLTVPESVLGRTAQVIAPQVDGAVLHAMLDQLLRAGDENPQYNVAEAPVIPPLAQPLCALGLVALVLRLRRPESWFLVALGIAVTIPVILSDELTHGLRVVGWFGVFPLLSALGMWLLLAAASRWLSAKWLYGVAAALWCALVMWQAVEARGLYRNFWQNPDAYRRWRVLETELNHSEWFFRTDIQRLLTWIAAQPFPVLIPFDYVNEIHARAWLVSPFPQPMPYRGEPLPVDTRLVRPNSATGAPLHDDAQHYVLLEDGRITLVPPLAEQTLAALTAVTPETNVAGFGSFGALADVYRLPDDAALMARQDVPALFFGDDLTLTGWSGARTLPQGRWDIALHWQPQRRIGHDYLAFVQLLTADYERITGLDGLMGGWAMPTTLWQQGERHLHPVTLEVPALPPGAYRLVAGVYAPFAAPLPAADAAGQPVSAPVTLAWVRVPWPEVTIPAEAVRVGAVFADDIALTAYEAEVQADGAVRVRLYWQMEAAQTALDPTIFVHLLDETGGIVAQVDTRPHDGAYPMLVWEQDEVVMTEHVLMTGDAHSGRIRVGLYTQPDLRNLPVTVDDVPQPDPFVLLDVPGR